MTVDILKSVWPEWQIEEQLGKGSYGVVYKAVRRDHNVESYAAIKVVSVPADSAEIDSLRAEGLDQEGTKTYLEGIVRDFVGEIQLMESLKGIQNIVSVEDYKVVEKSGELGWNILIRMELLTPFAVWMQEHPMTEAEVIRFGCDICTALEICGQRNIIHRDIKPENVFVNDFGHFKLGDFGIARKLENLTVGLSQKGTVSYMAPEVLSGNDYDARVDIYSLGLLLYRLLNGNRMPFLSEEDRLNPEARRIAMERRLRGEQLPPPEFASEAVAQMVLTACAFDRSKRFFTATAMKRALLSLQGSDALLAGAVPAGKPAGTSRGSEDRTVPARREPAEEGKTMPAGKKTAKGKTQAGQAVTTEKTKKKKKKAGGVIAVLLVLILLAGAAVYLLPKFLNREPADAEEPDDSVSQSEKKDDEEEKIEAALEEAEELAAEGDYEGAVDVLKKALRKYPDADELEEKQAEYEAAMAAAEEQAAADAAAAEEAATARAAALEEAAQLVEGRDYEGALALLQQTLDTYGEDPEVRLAYDNYEAEMTDLIVIREEYMTAAAEMSADGEHLEACLLIEELMESIGEDPTLFELRDAYLDAHVLSVLQEADELAMDGKVGEAQDVLNVAIMQCLSGECPDPDGAVSEQLQEYLKAVAEQATDEETIALLQSNPNQNPVPPITGRDVDIAASTDKASATVVDRENIYHASFSQENVENWYQFTTSSNYSNYRIECLNNSVDTTVYFTVFDAYDQQLQEVSMGRSSSGYINLALEADSTYRIRITRYNGGRMGNYQFRIGEEICDAGADKSKAFYIALGAKNTREFDVGGGICDWYRFKTTGNFSSYQFHLTNNSVDTTLYMTVFDSYDTELGQIDASKGNSAMMDLVLNPNQEYTVRLTRYNHEKLGHYTVTAKEMICDAGLAKETAMPKKLGTPVQGTMETTLDDWFSYQFTPGSHTLQMINNSIDTTTYATIFDEFGTELGQISVSKGDQTQLEFQVEANTTLYIRISRYTPSRFGTYTLTVR